MAALCRVATLGHENVSIDKYYEFKYAIPELLSAKDMLQFKRICEEGSGIVGDDEIRLYNDYFAIIEQGKTDVVEVSIGCFTEDMIEWGEALGHGNDYYLKQARMYSLAVHQLRAYERYLENRSAAENSYYSEFLVSLSFFFRSGVVADFELILIFIVLLP